MRGAALFGNLGIALSALFALLLAGLLLEILFLFFCRNSTPLQHHHHHPPPTTSPQLQTAKHRHPRKHHSRRRNSNNHHRSKSVRVDIPQFYRHHHHHHRHLSYEAALVGSFGGYSSSSSSSSSSSDADPSAAAAFDLPSSPSPYPSSATPHSESTSISWLFLPHPLQFSPLHGNLSTIDEETGEEVDLQHTPTCTSTGASPNVYTASSASCVLHHHPNAGMSPGSSNSLRGLAPNLYTCRESDSDTSGSPNNVSSQTVCDGDGETSSATPNRAPADTMEQTNQPDSGSGTPFATPPSSPSIIASSMVVVRGMASSSWMSTSSPSSVASSPVTAASRFSVTSMLMPPLPGSATGSPGMMVMPRLSVSSNNGSVSSSGSRVISRPSVDDSGPDSCAPVNEDENEDLSGNRRPLGAIFRRYYYAGSPSPSRYSPLHVVPSRSYRTSSVVVDFRRALPFSPPNVAASNSIFS